MNDMFIYDGVPSIEFGAYIFGTDSEFYSPERSIEKVSVPGRNGDLIFDNGRYENVSMVYGVIIPTNAKTNLRAFREFLYSHRGYHRLEDTLHNDEFYTAIVDGDIQPILTYDFDSAKFKLKFSRMPQRFLKTGEEPLEYYVGSSASYSIQFVNPTTMQAKPIIRVYGYGNLYVNGTRLTIKRHNMAYMDIDFDTEDAYINTTNLNEYLELPSYQDFPVLKSGRNVITCQSTTGAVTFSRIIITPRWWTI